MTRLLSVALLFGLVVSSTVVFAQAPPPSSNSVGAPIDGVVALLLTAGVGYGVYRSRKESE